MTPGRAEYFSIVESVKRDTQDVLSIYDLPLDLLILVTALIFVGYCWLGCIFLRPVLRMFVKSRDGTNDVVGYVLSCFCVFYGLLLGLIAVASYQNLSAVEHNVAREVAALDALNQDVGTYPAPYGQNLKWLLRDYCRYVFKYAWDEYADGEIPSGEHTRISAFHERLLAFEPKTDTQKIVHAETIRQFNVFLEHHRVRENSVTTGIPMVMWYVVFMGAVLNITLVWMFDMKLVAHLFLGGILSFFMGMMILMIGVMDRPFQGDVSVSSAPFETLYWAKMRD
jgi:hypothetical protein